MDKGAGKPPGPRPPSHDGALRPLLAAALLTWIVLLACQGFVGPFDGYSQAHALSGTLELASGPMLAGIGARIAGHGESGTTYAASLVLATVLGAFAVARLVRARDEAVIPLRHSVYWCGGILVALCFFNLPYLSNDVYLYRAYGTMLAGFDASPYTTTPQNVLPPADLGGVPWTGQTSPYGPVALFLFSLPARFFTTMPAQFWALKTLMAAPLVGAFFTARSLAGGAAASVRSFAWLALSPVLLLEIIENAHLDGWVGALVLVAILLAHRPGTLAAIGAGALIAAACAIKPTAAVTLGAFAVHFARPGRGATSPTSRMPAAVRCLLMFAGFALVAGVAYAMVWQGAATISGLSVESRKVMRSLLALVSWLGRFEAATVAQVVGALWAAAFLIGAALRWRNIGLPAAVLTAMTVQSVFGAAFLQPWHLTAPVIVASALVLGDRRAMGAGTWVDRLADARLWLLYGTAFVAGGYAFFLAAASTSMSMQFWSTLAMTVPVLAGLACWRTCRVPR